MSLLVIIKTEHYFHFEFAWFQLPPTRYCSVCQFKKLPVPQIYLPI